MWLQRGPRKTKNRELAAPLRRLFAFVLSRANQQHLLVVEPFYTSEPQRMRLGEAFPRAIGFTRCSCKIFERQECDQRWPTGC